MVGHRRERAGGDGADDLTSYRRINWDALWREYLATWGDLPNAKLMPYVEFMFRLEAAALRQLVTAGAMALAQGGSEQASMAVIHLREAANLD